MNGRLLTLQHQYQFQNNESSLGIFFDLAKAFDTVDQHILFVQLNAYGIRGT